MTIRVFFLGKPNVYFYLIFQLTKQKTMKPARCLFSLAAVLSVPTVCLGAAPPLALGAGNCSVGNSASIDIGEDQSIATIRGRAGVAHLQHNKLEVAQGMVYLNGLSYGPLGKKCEVKLVVTRSSSKLFVDDEPRVQPAAK